MSVKIFLTNLGKEVEVDAGELKNLLHQGLIRAEDYVKAMEAEVKKASPAYKVKAENDLEKAKADAKMAMDSAESLAKDAEKKIAAEVSAVKAEAEKSENSAPKPAPPAQPAPPKPAEETK